MSKKPRVLIVFSRPRKGSRFRRLEVIISELLVRGYEVHYMAARPLASGPEEGLVAHLIKTPFYHPKEGPWFWICYSFAAPFYLIGLALRYRFSTILVNDPPFAIVSSPAAFLSRSKLVQFVSAAPWRVRRALGYGVFTRTLGFLRDSLSFFLSGKLVAASSTTKDELISRLSFLKSRLSILNYAVIPTEESDSENLPRVRENRGKRLFRRQAPIDEKRLAILQRYNIPEKSFLIATAGALTVRKNVEALVRAVGSLEDDRIALFVIGDGPEKGSIQSIVVGLGLTERVVVTGWLDSPVEIAGHCDLFVLPSEDEGIDMVMLEVLGAGVPLLAAETAEMREFLEHDELLIAPSHVGKIAKRLAELSCNKQALAKVRRLSLEQGEKYSFDFGERLGELLEGK